MTAEFPPAATVPTVANTLSMAAEYSPWPNYDRHGHTSRAFAALNLECSPGFNRRIGLSDIWFPLAPQPLQQASEATVSAVELQANSQVEESFDEHSI